MARLRANPIDNDEHELMTILAYGSAHRFSRRMRYCCVATLFALQVICTARQMSPAYDEVALVPAGYVRLQTGLWLNLVPFHPPLIGGY